MNYQGIKDTDELHEGDLVRFWTVEECEAYYKGKHKASNATANWGEIGWVVALDGGHLVKVEFSNPKWTRNIGRGALTLISRYEDDVMKVLGEDYL